VLTDREQLRIDIAITLLENLGTGVFTDMSDVRDFLDDVAELVSDDWEKIQGD
jgi:hypothetical protein